jgi:ABC-type lipoprotein release transport system permease subunit
MLSIDLHKYCLRLALKDLFHNAVSTILIVLVIGAICLPLLIVSSLREGYMSILKRSIENSTQAKRIDIAATPTIAQQQYMTDSVLERFRKLPGVVEVVPQKSRTVYILDKDNNQVDFEAITTIPTDPDLKRFGFAGKFDDSKELAVVIREREALQDLGFEAVPDMLNVVVTRTVKGRVESYFLPCKVLGTTTGGPSRKVYVTVPMAKKLERWTLGFGVPEYELPPAPDREEALGAPEADSCLAISPLRLTDRKKQLLSTIKMEAHDDEASFEGLYLYKITPKTDTTKTITESERELIQDTLSGDINVTVILNIKPLQLNINGKIVSLHPSITADARSKFLLEKGGHWLNTQRERFEIVLPATVELEPQEQPPPANSVGNTPEPANAPDERAKFPRALKTSLKENPLQFQVVGNTKGEVGYIDYVLLHRLHQLAEQKATYSLKHKAFDVNAKSPYEDRFLIARVHVEDIEDIISVINYFEGKKYEIYASSKTSVEDLRNTNRILRNLMLLVGVTGGLAGIASLFVLMYEAIKRKRSEIGIMRAMGLSKRFITWMFLYQSWFYGIVGFGISFLLFQGLALTLDNTIGHAILSIEGLEGRIFQSSIILILGFVVGVILISFIAGRSAAQSARNVDPADILSGN